MRVLFIGGNGHHYLAKAVEAGLAECVGGAGDGYDNAAAKNWMAKRFGEDVPFHEDFHDAIAAFKPDVVSIGSIYAHNGDVAIACLEHGLPVVSDKPIATTWEQLARVEAACKRREATLLTEFNLRSTPAFRAAHEAVQAGEIGTPVLATAQKSYRFGAQRPDFYKRRETYGGTLLWVASHGIDIIWYVTGVNFARVNGHQGNLAKPDYGEMEDHAAVCYELANGGTAITHADFLRPAKAPTHGDDRLRVVGSTGQVEVRDGVCKLITQDAEPADITDRGRDASTPHDLIAALNGDSRHYCTASTLYMARVLLTSRDAADAMSTHAIEPAGM